ncbi:WD40 repeat domain-containing protein [Chitinophaga pinensis]|uniref:WD40 repeat domain-containing protein n=1 Tax=Chitinophaga pinensis (strain ATCC 43595 / DSM 2588 / LMG 13176 / NBRC 15968 / NCIMB 11800 / UQM 2034) TaxID=485918 RepID=A0A979G6N5_CHIPD|nr:WD40 repeat domain-containing protein [Chitinophaga pinensis]ACU61720.1 conserved hypothetical protein [Chitinophaga pinensis DSM 2588]
MQHILSDIQTGKETILRCDDTTFTTETNTGGKIKTTSKPAADAAAARQLFFKKEWELLKKGAVLQADHATEGDVLLHLFIGGAYTGCLSFEATHQGIYVYRSGGTEIGLQEELLRIDKQGVINEVIALPKVLPWEICYDTSANQLLLDLDHYAYEYDLGTGVFKQLTDHLQQPASFVSVAAGTWAYATHPHFYMQGARDGKRIETAFEVKIINGTIPFCGSLSPDGKLLALHNREHQVDLIDTSAGKLVNTLELPFGMAEQLTWTRDGSELVVHERYSHLHFFNVATGKEVFYEGLVIPAYTKDVRNFCFSEDQSLLVCQQRTTSFVFDFINKQFLYSFPIQHCVKSAKIKFIDTKKLGVRTDYGCFSIYAL